MKQALCGLLLFVCFLPIPSQAADPPAPPIIAALETELKRAQSRLRLKGYEAPYFMAYTLRDYHQREIAARFGALTTLIDTRTRQAHAEVRVGDYQLDNSSSNHDVAIDLDDGGEMPWEPPTETALDDDPEVLCAPRCGCSPTLQVQAGAGGLRQKARAARQHHGRG